MTNVPGSMILYLLVYAYEKYNRETTKVKMLVSWRQLFIEQTK